MHVHETNMNLYHKHFLFFILGYIGIYRMIIYRIVTVGKLKIIGYRGNQFLEKKQIVQNYLYFKQSAVLSFERRMLR